MANLANLVVRGISRLGNVIASKVTADSFVGTATNTEFIVGTQSASTGTWIGTSQDSELYDGKEILYYLPYAGSGNATLNLTLSSGGTTGAKNVYLQGTTRCSTQYPQYSVIRMTYHSSLRIGNTNYAGWWTEPGCDTDTDTYWAICNNGPVKAASAISAGNIIVGTSSGYVKAVSGATFDISYPILFAEAAISSGNTSTATYSAYHNVNIATTKSSWTGTTYSEVYLVLSGISGKTATIDSTVFTTTQPTSANNKLYIPLGLLHTSTNCLFFPRGQIMKYTNGAFSAYSTVVDYAEQAALATKATGDESGNNIKASYAAAISIDGATITLKNKNNASLGTVTVPSGENNAVTQTISSTNNAEYRVLFSSTADDTTRTEGARKDTDFKYNPSSNTLTVGTVSGALSGNASTATKATQDGSGNTITTYYEPKANVTSKGSATQPVYFDSSGVAQSTTYTLNASVPSGAVFTDTKYTFTGGTNKFTVTPSGGTAQDVTITPSITNNVTGSGTSGYIAKFNGANTITSGPQLGSGTDSYLRNDGSWAAPNDLYPLYGKIGTEIPANANLDSYKTAGTYYSPDSTRTGTLSNSPHTGSGFKLYVELSYGTSRVFQTVKANNIRDVYGRYYNASSWSAWRRLNENYTANTTSIGSASAGTAISADDITSWNAGSVPSITYSAKSVGSASGWSAGTAASASVAGGVLTITNGTAPSLTITSVDCDDITAWNAGSVPSLSYTSRSIPNISVTSTTVATGITAS